jgi:hypothetical protein
MERDELRWLVKNRSRIQRLLLRLLELGPPETPESRALRNLLIGAGFSLWRAAFLAETPDKQGDEAIEEFLTKLVWDNQIGYPQDKQTRDWTSAYYINNACFRLYKAIDLIKLPRNYFDHDSFDFVERAATKLEGVASIKRMPAWDHAYTIALRLLQELRR